MLKKISIFALALVVSVSIALSASAQTSSAPVLYDQNGNVVNGYNSGTGTLNPGWYYNSSGQQVYYYSNGTYYNPTTQQYGGTAYYSSGTGPTTGSSVTMPATSGITSGTMPTFYNAAGQPQNTTSGVATPAGWYYTQPGAQGAQVYYYGNGTFYNPSTGQYGGSVTNPNGTAGFYYGTYSGGGTVTPGVPNTGTGGASLATLIALFATVIVAGASVVYLARRPALS